MKSWLPKLEWFGSGFGVCPNLEYRRIFVPEDTNLRQKTQTCSLLIVWINLLNLVNLLINLLDFLQNTSIHSNKQGKFLGGNSQVDLLGRRCSNKTVAKWLQRHNHRNKKCSSISGWSNDPQRPGISAGVSECAAA